MGQIFSLPNKQPPQARWWIWALLANSNWARIPEVRNIFPAVVVNLFPDAAGGSDTDIGRGLGGCIWTEEERKPWVYMAWPRVIQLGIKNRAGHKFNNKLTMLEGAAALALMCSEPLLLKGRNIKVWTDNSGLAYSFKKGNSSCPYAATIIKAMDSVARALDCKLIVVKTPRVSGEGEFVADALSKGRISEALDRLPGHRGGPSEIPRTLAKWLEWPTPSRVLGQAIVHEIGRHTETLKWSLEDSEEVELITWTSGKRKPEWAGWRDS